MVWNVDDQEIINIGGSLSKLTFENQLEKAVKGDGADFLKEIAYTAGMDYWNKIADRSYQTIDELEVIERTASDIASAMPSGTTIIDMGAANSAKYELYVRAFLEQGKTCTYAALDLLGVSLLDQLDLAKDKFPEVTCVGLWGTFEDGDDFFPQIPGSRLFLSLGSIFFNATDSVCADRCSAFVKNLRPGDRLIVGQDGPTGADIVVSHASYQTEAYDAFFTRYLRGIQEHAGISADPKKAWSVTSRMDHSMHYFEVIAQEPLTCTKFGDFVVEDGTVYKMFPSWKRGERECHRIAEAHDLDVVTLGQATNSGMRQYIVEKREDRVEA